MKMDEKMAEKIVLAFSGGLDTSFVWFTLKKKESSM